jgi:hypothetical protein
MPMRDWLIGLGVAAALMLTTWATLIVLAKRLPPGILRDLAAFIPDCLTTIRSLRKTLRYRVRPNRGHHRRAVGRLTDRSDPAGCSDSAVAGHTRTATNPETGTPLVRAALLTLDQTSALPHSARTDVASYRRVWRCG